MPKKGVIFSFLVLIASLIVFSYKRTTTVKSATVTHVVISEVQISGDGTDASNDEFVELHNPSYSPVVMVNWRLTRKNSSGTEDNLVLHLNGTIPPHGFFLIGHGTGYNGSVPLDVPYSAASNALTNNYAVLLYSDAKITLVDKVGFGSALDFNTQAAPNPSANGSIERKAKSTSTESSMSSGGEDEFLGNGEDTENNANDFIVRTISDPQNSNSPIENPNPPETPTLEPSPTEPPTETPIPTEEPTQTPEPTAVPTETPTPIIEPTLEPTPTIEVTPTQEPSPTIEPSSTPTPTEIPVPTETPEPTLEITPTIEPSPTQIPTPTLEPSPAAHVIGKFYFPRKIVECSLIFKIKKLKFFTIFLPTVRCKNYNSEFNSTNYYIFRSAWSKNRLK